MTSIRILKQSQDHSVRNFLTLLFQELSPPAKRSKRINASHPVDIALVNLQHLADDIQNYLLQMQRLYLLFCNGVSALLMNDNFYAFSYD